MPQYNNDHRIDDSKTVTLYYNDQPTRTTLHTYRKCQGIQQRFNGPNSGKFIPGIVRINSMDATRTTQSLGHGYWRSVYGYTQQNACSIDGLVCGAVAWRKATLKGAGSDWDGALVGYAVQRAHAAMIDSAWDGGEFLAELPETIAMVRTGIGGLLKAVRSAQQSGFTWNRADRARIKLLKGRSIKSLPKKLANAWLTWRYGIRPIIWDVQDIIKIANGIAIKSDFSGLQRRRGRTKVSSSDSISYKGLNANGGSLYGSANEFVEFERKAEAVVYFKYGSEFGPINDILMRYGLHPNQFPSLLWQLRPLSFMLDWFVDVNTWVRAITPKWGMKILGCSCSQKTTVTGTRIITPYTSPSKYPFTGAPVEDKIVIERIVRRPQSLLGEFPRLKPHIILSAEQQADMLSVFLQRALNQRRH